MKVLYSILLSRRLKCSIRWRFRDASGPVLTVLYTLAASAVARFAGTTMLPDRAKLLVQCYEPLVAPLCVANLLTPAQPVAEAPEVPATLNIWQSLTWLRLLSLPMVPVTRLVLSLQTLPNSLTFRRWTGRRSVVNVADGCLLALSSPLAVLAPYGTSPMKYVAAAATVLLLRPRVAPSVLTVAPSRTACVWVVSQPLAPPCLPLALTPTASLTLKPLVLSAVTTMCPMLALVPAMVARGAHR